MKFHHFCLKILALLFFGLVTANAMAQSMVELTSITDDVRAHERSRVSEGDIITFTFTVKNSGTDTLNVFVNPGKTPMEGSPGLSPRDGITMSRGTTNNIRGYYTVTAQDILSNGVVLIEPTAYAYLGQIEGKYQNGSNYYVDFNNPGTTSFTVNKLFSDENPATVQISLKCTEATIDNATKPASMGNPAVFQLSAIGDYNTCTAIEQRVPEGYETDNSDCTAKSAGPESSSSCQIINTLIDSTASFTVNKVFSDENSATVQVNLSCTDATIDNATKPASMGNPAVFQLSAVGYDNTCTATEQNVPEGYEADNSDCAAKSAGAESANSCQITNTLIPDTASFTVGKVFSDENSATVQVNLSCTDATIDNATKPASMGNPAVFQLSDVGSGNNCTATEQNVPEGYEADNSDCAAKSAGPESSSSCQITNTLIESTASFTVSKVFSDENSAEVQVSLSCTDATIDNATKPASMGYPAVFQLSDVGSGNSCTATEQNVPEAYEADNSDCAAKSAGPDSSSSCQITNTLIESTASFTVSKVFSDENSATVQVNLSCTDATIDNATKPASMGNPAVFQLSDVGSGNACTATEQNVPEAYEADNSDCAAKSAGPESSSSCQITNTLIPSTASFTVSKVFSDENSATVQVNLSCTDATIDNATKPASMGNPAVFQLSDVGSGNACTATEQNVPEAYEADNSDCAAKSAGPESSSSCQITNTLIPSTASFTVSKVFSDQNSSEVQVNLSCTDATIDNATKPASMGNPAVFQLSAVGSGNSCTATEQNVPEGYEADNSDCAAKSAGPESSSSCQITNTLIPSTANFTVSKVFSDDNSATVQVNLSCTDATIDNATKPASMGNPAVFQLSAVGSGNTCTATEQNVPEGYEADNSDCAAKSAGPESANNCQITNTVVTPQDTTFEVSIIGFSDSVQVNLECTDASIDDSTKPASESSPALFTLNNVGEDNACTAKTEPPNGFLVTGCNDVPAAPEQASSCGLNFTLVFPPDDSDPVTNGIPTEEYILSTCQDADNEPDYQALCNSYVGAVLTNPEVAAEATKQIKLENAAAVRQTGMQTTMAQVSAVDGRLGTLRGGGGAGFSASGFSLSVGDAMVSGGLLKSFLSNFNQNNPDFMQAYSNQYQPDGLQAMPFGNPGQLNAGQSSNSGFLDEFGRWGVWISGRIIVGEKDLTTRQYNYDFETAGLTFGTDYRFNDSLVAGVAVGYANTSADIGSDNADLDTDGYSISLYGTWFKGDRFYMAGSLGYGGNNYDQLRNVRYNLLPGSTNPYVNVDESLKAKYDGSQFSATISGGWDFNKNGWTFGPTFSLNFADVKVDAYDETLVTGGGPLGNTGWAAHVDKQKYQSLQPSIGFGASKPYSRTWGVIIPEAYIDIVAEVKDGSREITGSFLGANEGNKRFSLLTDDFEETFARGGIGLGFVFKNNKSAFLMVDVDLGRDLLSTYYLNAGFRWQF